MPIDIPPIIIAELKFSLAIRIISGIIYAIIHKKPVKLSSALLFLYTAYDIKSIAAILLISEG